MKDPFPGNYLYAEDLNGDATATIEAIVEPNTEKAADGRVIDKPMLKFKGTEKKLICNRTNWALAKITLGPDFSAWPGQKLTLEVRYIDAFGDKDSPCIRIKPPENRPLRKGIKKFLGSLEPKHLTNPSA